MTTADLLAYSTCLGLVGFSSVPASISVFFDIPQHHHSFQKLLPTTVLQSTYIHLCIYLMEMNFSLLKRLYYSIPHSSTRFNMNSDAPSCATSYTYYRCDVDQIMIRMWEVLIGGNCLSCIPNLLDFNDKP